jgi:glucose-1-phosphatase
MPLQNIIFDLGGVIINLDYSLTSKAFKVLGIKEFDSIYSKAKQEQLFDEFEKGNIPASEFRKILGKHLPEGVTDAQIDSAWNAMLLELPGKRVAWLKSLSKHYRIFLLSNTNAIHVAAFTKMASEKFGNGVFESTFEKTYYSCNIHMRKPDAEIFELVLAENNLERQNTLFIDDSIQHVEGAHKINLPAEWLQLEKGESLEKKYENLLK